MIENINKRERTLIISVCILLFLYAYFTYYLNPILKRISSTRNSIEDLRVKSLTTSEKSEAVSNNKSYQIPSMENNPEMAYNIMAAVNKCRVNLNDIIFGEPITSNTYDRLVKNNIKTVSVKINVDGTCNNVMEFINTLENDKNNFNIDNISLKDKGTNIFEGNINVKYYFVNIANGGY